MAAQSPQVSPPPTYTIVPPTPTITPHNETFMTRFIESMPRNSSSSPPSMTLPRLHTQPQPQSQPQPQPPPISPTSNEGNVASPVRSNSGRSVLSRRLRHGSLRLSPTAPIRSGTRDDRHTRSSSSTLPSSALAAEPSQHAGQPQLPQILRISPIIPPSQLPTLSTFGPPSEVISTSVAAQGHNVSTSPVTRRHIPDFEEDAPPSPGSIASTGISPSLMLRRAQLERRIDEAMNDFAHDRAPDSILPNQRHQLVGTGDKGESTSNKSLEIPPQAGRDAINPQPRPTREHDVSSQRSPKSGSPLSLSPSHKPGSKHSQRSVSQPLSLTASHQLLERHPNQLFAMQTSDQPHNGSGATTPKLSYTSLRIDPVQHDRTPSGSIVLPPTLEAALDNQTEALEHPHHDTPIHVILQHPSSPAAGQPQALQAAAETEDREGSRVALSSVSGSPRRSIPRHDSPEVSDRGSGSDRTTTPTPVGHMPRRRKQESVAALQAQSPREHPVPPLAVVPQPVDLATGSLGDISAMSYPSSRGQSASGTHTSGVSQPAQALLIANPPPRRTLDSVRSQVAREIALRAVSSSNVVDGVRVGVTDASSAWSGPNDIPFVHLISSSINALFALSSTPYLFIITATSFSPTSSSKRENGSTSASPTAGLLYITSSSREITSRAVHLTCSKFIGRITSSSYTFSTPDVDVENAGDVSLGLATKELEWMARIKELHFSSFDSDVIHSILLTASRTPLDPTVPPPNSKSIDVLLEEARAQLTRITPRQALTELRNSIMDVPTVLVDIRPQAQREEFGEVLGALIVERNVLEWRFDPRCESRLPVADRYDLRVIVFCQEGYTSGLAARSLQQLGLLNATDMIGGYKAWREAGLPVKIKPLRERSIVSAAGSIV